MKMRLRNSFSGGLLQTGGQNGRKKNAPQGVKGAKQPAKPVAKRQRNRSGFHSVGDEKKKKKTRAKRGSPKKGVS